MKFRSCTYGLAILASVSLLAIPAQVAKSEDLRWSQDRLSTLNAAIAGWEQDFSKQQVRQALEDRLSRFNAAIAGLEQDAAKLNVAFRAKAEAALKALQDTRDAFRAKIKEPGANMRDDQVAANAFRAELDVYLDAVHADIETRQAVMQHQFVRLRSD